MLYLVVIVGWRSDFDFFLIVSWQLAVGSWQASFLNFDGSCYRRSTDGMVPYNPNLDTIDKNHFMYVLSMM